MNQYVLDDYFVSFWCLPTVDYVHGQDQDVPGPGFDLDESLQPKRPLFEYFLAYATLPFLILHVSLIVCFCAAGRRDAWFREGFFVVLIALLTVDAVAIVHVRTVW